MGHVPNPQQPTLRLSTTVMPKQEYFSYTRRLAVSDHPDKGRVPAVLIKQSPPMNLRGRTWPSLLRAHKNIGSDPASPKKGKVAGL